MNRIKRNAPRIISRSYIEKKRRIDDDNTKAEVPDDIEAELQSEILVKGGVVRAKQREHISEIRSEPVLHHNFPSNNDFLCFDGNEPSSSSDAHVQLPGTADEVESYPCPVCGPHRVFLTFNGLEKHGREEHPDDLQEIKDSIDRIQSEWARRRNQNQQYIKIGSSLYDQKVIVIRKSGSLRSDGTYERCPICSILINTQLATSMEHHMQIHIKNKAIRQQNFDDYRKETLKPCYLCKYCNFGFNEENKLIDHHKKFHPIVDKEIVQYIKKRTYVCRWCGKMFANMSDLNMHKQEVHNISTTSRYIDYEVGTNANTSQLNPPDTDAIANENVIGSAKCEICNFYVSRPSLIISHMFNVHNLTEFSSEISSHFISPVKFLIKENGTVVWFCCNNSFDDRASILFHRRSVHRRPPIFDMQQGVLNKDEHSNLQIDGVPITCQEILLETEPNVSEFLVVEKLDNNVSQNALNPEDYDDDPKESSPPSLTMEIGTENGSNLPENITIN